MKYFTIAAFLLLAGCGPAVDAAGAAPAAVPTVTVTATVTADADPVAPQPCLDALDEADKIIDISSETMGIVAEAFDAVSRFDVDGINDAAERINAQTDKLNEVRYPEYAAACRAAAG